MKPIIITIYFSFFFCLAQAQSSVYNLKLANSKGDTLTMGSLQERRILVFVTDAVNPDREYLRALDTLYRSHILSLAVIIVPALDFSEGDAAAIQRRWADTLNVNTWIAMPSKVKKASGAQQHPLMEWLSNAKKNGTSGRDISNGQLFFLSRGLGWVYAQQDAPVSIRGAYMKQMLKR